MSRRTRRTHPPGFEAKAALVAIMGETTLADLAQQYGVHPNQVTNWKARLLQGAARVFGIYEEIYLPAYDSVGEAIGSLGRCLAFHNRRRPHSSLSARTPDRAYFDDMPQFAAA